MISLGKYKEFYGEIRQLMPLLTSGVDAKGRIIDVPRVPATILEIIERRLQAPMDVSSNWNGNSFITGDVSIAGVNGDQLIVHDSEHIRNIDRESEFYRGGLVLSQNTWDELRERRDGTVLYLSSEELQMAPMLCLEKIEAPRQMNSWFFQIV